MKVVPIIGASCVLMVCIVEMSAGEGSISLPTTNEIAGSSEVIRHIIETAPRIEESNYRSLAFDANCIYPQGELTLHFRFKRPDKYAFVVVNERDSMPMMMATRDSCVFYDVAKDRLRYYAETNRPHIQFGMESNSLSLVWNVTSVTASEKPSKMVLLDFKGVMPVVGRGLVDRNVEVLSRAADNLLRFSGHTEKGSACTLVFENRASIPYRSAEFNFSGLRICFEKILGDVEINESAFEWQKGDLVKRGLVAEPAGQSGRFDVAMQNMLSQVYLVAPESALLKQKGPSETALMFKESVQKMIEPVTGTNGLSHIE